MKARHIYLIIALMSISVFGAGAVQWYWISQAMAEKERQFDMHVNEALREVVDQLETHEAAFFIREADLPILEEEKKGEKGETKRKVFRKKVEFKYNSTHTGNRKDSLEITMISGGNGEVEIEQYKVGGREPKEMKTWVDSMHLEHKVTKYKKVLEKMVIENYTLNAPVEFRLAKVDLPALIRESLQSRQIDLDFKYGVFNPSQHQYLPAFSSDELPALMAQSAYSSNLFPYAINEKSYDLHVVFPGKSRFMLGSMLWIGLVSFLFSVIMLTTFGSTLYFIFRQKRVSQMKMDFINNMTHEFKTPIATISLALDAMKLSGSNTENDQAVHYRQIIKEENHRLNKQVEKVLQMALLERKELKFVKDSCAFHAMVRQAARQMELQFAARHAKLELKLEASHDTIIADAHHLQNVLLNLMDNALKYSAGTPDVLIESRNVNNGLLFSISDKGIGMSRETVKRIFDPFYRAGSGNLHDVKGFGLGLSYVKEIVEGHHAKIEVESELKKGTRIRIWWPQ